jgi:integrase/recombinase XerD
VEGGIAGPWMIRPGNAMRLLLAGVDITVIALWLGHESLASTQACLHADMHQKQEAIGKTAPPGTRQKRYQPPGPLLEFLENL